MSDILTHINYFNDCYRLQLKKLNFTSVDFKEKILLLKSVHNAVPG